MYNGLRALFPAVALTGLIAGCTTEFVGPDDQAAARQAASVYGTVAKNDNRAEFSHYDPDGKGFSLHRGFSLKPYPDVFLPNPTGSYEDSFVVDYAVDMREEKGFPVYRLGVRPLKISKEEVRYWPSFVTINTVPEVGAPSRLVARLPQDRKTDKYGFIWTDVTYCPDCFGLSDMKRGIEAGVGGSADLVSKGAAFAAARSGSTDAYEGVLKFSEFAGDGILEGDKALSMAPIASAQVALARQSQARIEPARAEYMEFAKSYTQERTPENVLLSACGRYEPPVGDDGIDRDERSRVDEIVLCMGKELERFDYAARAKRIEELGLLEQKLAFEGHIEPQNRFSLYSLEEEISFAHLAVTDVKSRYVAWKTLPAKNAIPEGVAIARAPEPAVVADPMDDEQDDYVINAAPPASASTVHKAPIVVAPSSDEPELQPHDTPNPGAPLCPIAFMCPE